MDEEQTPGHKDFFISYTGKDSHWAQWIAWQLEDAGHSTLIAWLRQPPGAACPASFQKVVERLRWIREVGLDPQVRSRIHHDRL